MSERSRELFAWSPDGEVTLSRVLAAVAPEDRQAVEGAIRDAADSGRAVAVEYRITLPDGGTRWILSTGRAQPAVGERPVLLLGTSVDVTERRRHEEELRRSYEQGHAGKARRSGVAGNSTHITRWLWVEVSRSSCDASKSFPWKEVERLKQQLEAENTYLRREHRVQHGGGRIVGESAAITAVLALAEQVAPARTTVLLEGETGTGKELFAHRVHELSPRRDRAMVKVNCSALPSSLVESELFGREKGAYTGAVSREPGRFEVADGSTLFLDEVSELPLELQAKLLRVLEQGQFERVGSSRTLRTDVRVIAASNRDLKAEVQAGRFRRDLYFRLAVFPIRIPPLRERRDDIPLLVWSMVGELGAEMNRAVETIRRQEMERLQRYDWPGNVRELRNAVERALVLSDGPVLAIEPPGAPPAAADDGLVSLDEAQRREIRRALAATGGRISGSGGAAERLGLKPTTLRSRMERLGVVSTRAGHDRPSF